MSRAGWKLFAVAAALVAGLAPRAASAQQVTVELRAGAAVGNYTDTDAGLDFAPQPAYGATVEVWPRETFAGYVGFSRLAFGCEEGFCTDRDVSLTSQGITAGVRWAPGLPWVRAGVAFMGLDVDTEGASESIDPGLGFEVAGGVELQLGQTFRIRPGVSYIRHDASTDLGDGHVAILTATVGVAVPVASF